MSEAARQLVVVTNHFINSRRMGNIHWLVREFRRRGYEVTVLITGFSALARFRGDRRTAYFNASNNRRFETVAPGVRQTCLYTPWHPFNSRRPWLNALLRPLVALYPWLALHQGAKTALAAADIVLIETGVPLLLVDSIRRIAPSARMVYRVSDDLAHLRCHPAIPAAEQAHAAGFDCISMQSSLLAYRFPGLPKVKVHPQSIAVDVLAEPRPDPYPARKPGQLRILSVGSSFFDHHGLEMALTAAPEHAFSIVGDIRRPPSAHPNASYLGEMPFETTLAYIQHCDVALALYDADRAGPSLAESSSKIAQYLFYGKPVITLEQIVAASSASGLSAYRQNDADSMRRAIATAIAGRERVPRQRPPLAWSDIVEDMIG
jgi:2-beta-glucuronyltransferase